MQCKSNLITYVKSGQQLTPSVTPRLHFLGGTKAQDLSKLTRSESLETLFNGKKKCWCCAAHSVFPFPVMMVTAAASNHRLHLHQQLHVVLMPISMDCCTAFLASIGSQHRAGRKASSLEIEEFAMEATHFVPWFCYSKMVFHSWIPKGISRICLPFVSGLHTQLTFCPDCPARIPWSWFTIYIRLIWTCINFMTYCEILIGSKKFS